MRFLNTGRWEGGSNGPPLAHKSHSEWRGPSTLIIYSNLFV